MANQRVLAIFTRTECRVTAQSWKPPRARLSVWLLL